MNKYFLAASILSFVIGLVHSLLGEKLIFRRLRTSGIVPTQGGSALREPHVRILWASWHIVTVMGWCFAVFLYWLAMPLSQGLIVTTLTVPIAVVMLLSSVLVLVGTRGRHMGWLGLLGVAILVLLGTYV